MKVFERQSVPRLVLILAVGALSIYVVRTRWNAFRPVDRIPNSFGSGRLESAPQQMVLRLAGSPRALGEQHGRLLSRSIQVMLRGYVDTLVCRGDAEGKRELLARVRDCRPALPAWYVAELDACADAAGVDADELLLAQCEGDIMSLRGEPMRTPAACSAYVMLEAPCPDGRGMKIGRNFDYYCGRFLYHCVLTSYVSPRAEDGVAFLAVGWSGILGGWTLVNAHGLVVANHLGGGSATNARGVPTLVLTRMIAQKARDITEAVELLRNTPRMRGQIIWLAQPADPSSSRPARAVAVEFDAERLFVRESRDGVLVVTNRNLVFGCAPGEERVATGASGPYATLLMAVRSWEVGSAARIIAATGVGYTLHSVEIDFPGRTVYVAHGRVPAYRGPYVGHALP